MIYYISVTGAGRPQIHQIHNAILIHILNLIDCQATSIVRGTSDHTFGGLPSGTSFCPKFKKCLYYDFATNAVYESYLIVGCFRYGLCLIVQLGRQTIFFDFND